MTPTRPNTPAHKSAQAFSAIMEGAPRSQRSVSPPLLCASRCSSPLPHQLTRQKPNLLSRMDPCCTKDTMPSDMEPLSRQLKFGNRRCGRFMMPGVLSRRATLVLRWRELICRWDSIPVPHRTSMWSSFSPRGKTVLVRLLRWNCLVKPISREAVRTPRWKHFSLLDSRQVKQAIRFEWPRLSIRSVPSRAHSNRTKRHWLLIRKRGA